MWGPVLLVHSLDTFLVRFWFLKDVLGKWYIGLKFSKITTKYCYALTRFRDGILIA